VSCHTPSVPTMSVAAKVAPDFSHASRECSGCHVRTDPHGGQFSQGPATEDCSTCHVTAAWKSVVFNHDKAKFTLDIAHRNVTCAKCHKPAGDTIRGKDAKAVVIYRGTPKECVQCH
jgi:hypothetical protein